MAESDPRGHDLFGNIEIRGEATLTQYIITDSDFLLIRSAGQSLWKDLFLAVAPLSVAVLLNAIALTESRSGALELRSVEAANYAVFLFGAAATAISGVAWWHHYSGLETVLTTIKNRPLRSRMGS